MFDLTNRENEILRLIVEDFVATAVPISSKSLCLRHELNISTATARNIMMKLESLGLLSQLHISSGRIPTDLGYRVYVDELMSVDNLSKIERSRVLKNLRKVSRDFDLIMVNATKLLGEISNQLGIILLPRLNEGIFTRLELVPISERRILLVVNIESGLVKTIMLDLDFNISREALELTTQVLNERLSGLTLGEIKSSIDKRLKSVSAGHQKLIDFFQSSANNLFDFNDWEQYYFRGTTNILRQPEFSNNEAVNSLMELLESKHSIVQFLGVSFDETRPLRVSIGSENIKARMEPFSLVTRGYRVGNVKGVLGIIGPTRMDYARMVSIVNYMSRAISQIASN